MQTWRANLETVNFHCLAEPSYLHEEDGSVTVRDDLDALLQVASFYKLFIIGYLLNCHKRWKVLTARSAICMLKLRPPWLLTSLAHWLTYPNKAAPLVQVLPQDIRGLLVNHPNRASLLEVSTPAHKFMIIELSILFMQPKLWTKKRTTCSMTLSALHFHLFAWMIHVSDRFVGMDSLIRIVIYCNESIVHGLNSLIECSP